MHAAWEALRGAPVWPGAPDTTTYESPCSRGAQVVRPSQERMPDVTWPFYVPPKTHTLKPELQGPWNETVFGGEVLKR